MRRGIAKSHLVLLRLVQLVERRILRRPQIVRHLRDIVAHQILLSALAPRATLRQAHALPLPRHCRHVREHLVLGWVPVNDNRAVGHVLVPRALRRLQPLQRRLHERRALLARPRDLLCNRLGLLHLDRSDPRRLPNPSGGRRTLLSTTLVARRRRLAADYDAVDLPAAGVRAFLCHLAF